MTGIIHVHQKQLLWDKTDGMENKWIQWLKPLPFPVLCCLDPISDADRGQQNQFQVLRKSKAMTSQLLLVASD